MPRFQPRFSLFTALPLMTIVGLAIVVVLQWREVGPLRGEVRRLHDEVGALSIDDPAKPCAIEIRTNDDFTWKWRFWIPKGQNYELRYLAGEIPEEGIPSPSGMSSLIEPGEYWVQYKISRDPSGIWFDKLETPDSGWPMGGHLQKWVKWQPRMVTSEGISYTTRVGERDKILVLTRYRVSKNATNAKNMEALSAGFMVWLQPTAY
jgi:hypothetical protein